MGGGVRWTCTHTCLFVCVCMSVYVDLCVCICTHILHYIYIQTYCNVSTCASPTQREIHYAHLTVRETLRFSAKCLGQGALPQLLADARQKEYGSLYLCVCVYGSLYLCVCVCVCRVIVVFAGAVINIQRLSIPHASSLIHPHFPYTLLPHTLLPHTLMYNCYTHPQPSPPIIQAQVVG